MGRTNKARFRQVLSNLDSVFVDHGRDHDRGSATVRAAVAAVGVCCCCCCCCCCGLHRCHEAEPHT
eukprot:3741175-Rhodomonas_salina.1